jgi:hypothetical protein
MNLALRFSVKDNRNVYKLHRSAYLRGSLPHIPRRSHAQSRLIARAMRYGRWK